MRCEKHFDVLNRIDVAHECDRHEDGQPKKYKKIYKNRSNLTGHVLYGLQHIQTENANFLKLNSSQAEKSFFQITSQSRVTME